MAFTKLASFVSALAALQVANGALHIAQEIVLVLNVGLWL